MEKTTKLIALIICVIFANLCNLCILSEAEGQDIHFSQFYHSPLTLNPAAAGVFKGNFRAINNYKDQWRSIAFPYKTLSVSLDMPFYREKITDGSLGIGVSFLNDRAGDLNFSTNQAVLSLSANKSVNKSNNFSIGLQGAFSRRSIDFTKLKSDKQFDGTEYHPDWSTGETNTFENYSYGDFAAGILWNFTSDESNKIHAGAALFHINRPDQSFYDLYEKLYSKLVLHGGGEINLKNTNTSIIPNILFLKQGQSYEVNAGALIRYVLKESSKYTGNVKGSAFSIGGGYRFNDAIVVAAIMELAKWKIGISYDVNISGLRDVSLGKGGFEISLIFITPNPFAKAKSEPKFL
ncbi:MAG: PorP/SprF family type IX secretion system membrane protein [Bacteroidota bacterium]